jgi:non-ribosomal peptide synthetase component F
MRSGMKGNDLSQRIAALPADLAQSLAALSRREGATLFMTLLAAFNVLLHRYTGQDRLIVVDFAISDP